MTFVDPRCRLEGVGIWGARFTNKNQENGLFPIRAISHSGSKKLDALGPGMFGNALASFQAALSPNAGFQVVHELQLQKAPQLRYQTMSFLKALGLEIPRALT